MIVDPWGHADREGVGRHRLGPTARIDHKVTARVRRDMPALEHRKRV